MLQGFLQTLNKPYAGPDYNACSVSMNKVWTKAVIEKEGIKIAPYVSIHLKEWKHSFRRSLKKIEETLSYPLVVKPASLGSSIDVFIVKNQISLKKAIEKVLILENQVVIEKKIQGREFEVAILEGEKFICPEPGEICSTARQYDYSAKYGSDNPIKKITRAKLSKARAQAIKTLAKKVYRALNAKGFIRIDLFIDKSGEIIFNEANPIPGCAPTSLFPKMLESYGLNPNQIGDEMVINGLYHHRLIQSKNRKAKIFVESI